MRTEFSRSPSVRIGTGPTASYDGRAYVWEAATGREVARVAHDAPISPSAYSPDGNQHAEAPGPAVAFARTDDT